MRISQWSCRLWKNPNHERRPEDRKRLDVNTRSLAPFRFLIEFHFNQCAALNRKLVFFPIFLFSHKDGNCNLKRGIWDPVRVDSVPSGHYGWNKRLTSANGSFLSFNSKIYFYACVLLCWNSERFGSWIIRWEAANARTEPFPVEWLRKLGLALN